MSPRLPLYVRQAAREDADAACAVLRRSITECCARDHRNDPAILAAWLGNKTPGNLRSWFSPPNHAVIAEENGVTVGVALMGANGMITLNYLLPEAQYKGIGKAMLEALEKEAATRGLTELTLSSTVTAHGFYLRNGYADTDRKSGLFGMSSTVMKKTLAPAPPAASY